MPKDVPMFGMSVEQLRERAAAIREHYTHGGSNVRPDRLPIDDLLSVTLDLPHRKVGDMGAMSTIDPCKSCNWHNLQTFMKEEGVHLKTIRFWHEDDKRWVYDAVAYKDPKDFTEYVRIIRNEGFTHNGERNRALGNLYYTPEKVEEYMQKTFTPEELKLPAIQFTPKEHAPLEWNFGKFEEISASYIRELATHPKLAFAGGTGVTGMGAHYMYKGITGLFSSKNDTAKDTSRDTTPTHASIAENLLYLVGGASQMTIGVHAIRTALKGHFMQFER